MDILDQSLWSVGIDFQKLADSMTLNLKKTWMVNMQNLKIEKAREALSKKFGNRAKKAGKKIKKNLSIALNVMGVFLQFLDKLAVLQPIMEILNGVFAMIGGSLMNVLGPALADFADVMFDEDHIQTWKDLGKVLGEIVVGTLPSLVTLLTTFAKVVTTLGSGIMIIIQIIVVFVLGLITGVLTIVYIIGALVAGVVDLVSMILNAISFGLIPKTDLGTAWNDFMFPAFADLGLAIGDVLGLQHGGYVSPTIGGTVIRAGEGGEGEFVIPESKMGSVGGGEEMVWATQDNGEKLDKIIYILGSQRKWD